MFFNKTKRTYSKYVGKNVMVTTMTYAYVGEVVKVDDELLTLTNASKIYDTGSFSECVGQGKLKETEPYPDGLEVDIALQNMVELCMWNHPLPRQRI